MTQAHSPDDAALAVAAAAGDRRAFAAIYDRYSGRLLGFCISMLRSRADAEDCLQDVFVIAATRLRDLREPAMLRSWLFSVARHECLGRIDKRRKEVPVDEIPDRAIVDEDVPADLALDAELAALLRDAQAGLSDRDRLLLELADRQQLSGEEFAKAVGVPRSTAYTLLARARATARKSIGALLVARTGRGQCETLDGMLAGWDGQLTTLRRKQIARHIEGCDVCSEHERRVASPAALLGEGRAYAMDLVALRTRILSAAVIAPALAWPGGWPPSDRLLTSPRRRRRGGLAAGVVAALLVIAAIGAGLHGSGRSVSGAGTALTPIPTLSLALTAPPASPTASPTVTPSRTPVSTVTVTHVVVVPPPTSSAATHSTTTKSKTPTTWTLTVDVTQTTVVIGGVAHPCAMFNATPCTYTVPDGSSVAVETGNLESDPLKCQGTVSQECTFTMTANDNVKPQPVIQ